MAVLKDIDGTQGLAPLYDVGPSFLDARAIVRVIRWDGEAPDRRDWNNIVANAAVRLEEAGVKFEGWPSLVNCMRDFAEVIDSLPEMMRDCGVASRIVENRRAEIARLVRELRALRETS
jgi:hypothetical protein